MAHEIEIDIREPAPPGIDSAVQSAVTTALDWVGAQPDSCLTIVLADDQFLHKLNVQFLQEDHPTDVLSFPAGDAMPGMPDDAPYLGDIAISVPYARRQSEEKGHQLVEEIQLLAVHGVLHLVGYDHTTADEKSQMWQAQGDILHQLGLSHVQPSEESHDA